MTEPVPIADLQRTTAERLSELELREAYDPTLPLIQHIRRRYNVSRTLADYCAKFPELSAHLRPGVRLLEIGAGEGVALRDMVNRFGIAAIATNLTAAPGSGFIAATGAALPFDADSFDVVVAIHSLTWEPQQRRALAEVRRVLRSGGTAFVNLFRFSEITTLWFGAEFWQDFDQAAYVQQYDFNEADYAGTASIRKDPVPCQPPLSSNYLITITKA